MANEFRITFLCTANRARSAVAQECARRSAEGLPVTIDSAGVRGVTGQPALNKAVSAAALLDLDLTLHRSTCLADLDLATSDLVLGFELEHVAAAVVEGGALPERSFTVKEFVRLTEGLAQPNDPNDVAHARTVVTKAHTRRSQMRGFVAGEEIADPVSRPSSYFEQSFREICSLCSETVDRLFTRRSESSLPGN